VADTIVRVLFYDPASERFVLATRDQPAFREHIYNMGVPVVLLRLWMRVKAGARYFVCRHDRDNPSSDDLLAALRDPEASNVEIRKTKASSAKVQVSKYYTAESQPTSGVAAPSLSEEKKATLEVPRDSLGRLWDRLEENPITSFLMHRLTRHFAWHVELFFTAEEFAVFWKTHTTLPLNKLQLRYIRRDGMPHSPFRDHDCVSIDLFMFRWHRKTFEAYLKQTFKVVRTNPGKHSH
jgi:hypothetical protein